jgi:hypothetical protein
MARRPDQRGSGTKTALLAAFAAWLFPNEPEAALTTCASTLGTDTDSIATMAGALLGSTLTEGPPATIADQTYFEREAQRLFVIGEQCQAASFPYPGLVKWTPPRNALDCLGANDAGLALAGLGPAHDRDEVFAGSGKNAGAWSWVDLWFGQRILAKRRPRPNPLPSSQLVNPTQEYITESLLDAPPRAEPRERQPIPTTPEPSHAAAQPRTLHVITDEVIASAFRPDDVGAALLELAERDDGIEAASQFAAIVAKARLSRRDRDRRKDNDSKP